MYKTKDNQTYRKGAVSQGVLLAVGSLVLLGVLSMMFMSPPKRTLTEETNGAGETTNDGKQGLVMYCAAGVKPPIADAAVQYAKEKFGTEIQ
ncbi:MAG: hypothetical protein JKY95_07365, partial [Planctomycetaceae bacterium]|nr:hypothetical protein [Planctomycetaceae bacterium]